MPHPLFCRAITYRRLAYLVLATLVVPIAADAQAPSEYAIEARIDMPHLRDNPSANDTTIVACLEEAGDVFPVLGNPAFASCSLGSSEQLGRDSLRLLVCSGASGTTDAALLRRGDDEVTGVLTVRMGGKNMTFAQRIRAQRRGACPAAQ